MGDLIKMGEFEEGVLWGKGSEVCVTTGKRLLF